VTFSRFLILFNLVLVGWAIYAGSERGELDYYFGEEQLITYLSAFQLVALALFTWFLFERDCAETSHSYWRCNGFPWLLMSLGFLFLGFDEVLQFHEKLDFAIHRWFSIKETALTDRLDDLIVVLFVILGLFTLYYYRSQLLRYRSALPLVLTGFSLAFLMGGLDMASNRPDIITDKNLFVLAGVTEEAAKVLAECVFLLAARHCWILRE
jgi:hypothetical protein